MPYDMDSMMYYARAGYTDLLSAAIDAKLRTGANLNDLDVKSLVSRCAFHGRAATLRFLVKEYDNISLEFPCYDAVRGGHLDLVNELYHDTCLPFNMYHAAFQYERMHVADWIASKTGVLPSDHWYYSACRASQLEILRWLRRHGVPFPNDPNIWLYVYNFSLEVRQWLAHLD